MKSRSERPIFQEERFNPAAIAAGKEFLVWCNAEGTTTMQLRLCWREWMLVLMTLVESAARAEGNGLDSTLPMSVAELISDALGASMGPEAFARIGALARTMQTGE
jgi:hypothetical protein